MHGAALNMLVVGIGRTCRQTLNRSKDAEHATGAAISWLILCSLVVYVYAKDTAAAHKMPHPTQHALMLGLCRLPNSKALEKAVKNSSFAHFSHLESELTGRHPAAV